MKLTLFNVDFKLLKQDILDKIDINISFFIVLLSIFILTVSTIETSAENMVNAIFLISKYIFFVYVFSLSLLQFYFLQDKGENIFYSCLPFSRQTIYRTKYCSGLILVLLPYCVLMILLFFFSLLFEVQISLTLVKFFRSILIACFWYTFSSFFSTFTYKRKMQFSLFIFTLISPIAIILCLIFLIETFTYLNIPLYSLYLLFLSFLNIKGSYISVDTKWIVLIVVFLTILIYILSLYILKTHNSEKVSTSYLPLKVKYFYIYLISIAISLVLLCSYAIALDLKNSTSSNISIFLNTALFMIIFILTSIIVSRIFGIPNHNSTFNNTRTALVVFSSVIAALFFNIYSTNNFYNYFDYYDDYVNKPDSGYDENLNINTNYMNPSVPFLYDGENFDEEYKKSILSYLYYIQDLYNEDPLNNHIKVRTIFVKEPLPIPKDLTEEFLRCYILDIYTDEDYTNCGFSSYSLFELEFINDLGEPISDINTTLTIKPNYSNTIDFLKEHFAEDNGVLPFDFQIITYKDASDELTKEISLNDKIKYVTFGTYNDQYFEQAFRQDPSNPHENFLDILIDKGYISDLTILDYNQDFDESIKFIHETKAFVVDDNYFTTELFFNKDVYRLVIREGGIYRNYGIFLK